MGKTEFIKTKSRSLFNKVKALPFWIKLGVLILLVIIGWFTRPLILGTTSKVPEYQTATVERGTLISSVTASGSIASGNSASLTTNATGVVNDVLVSNGDSVKQGDAIATLTLDQASLQKQTAAWASYLSAQNALNAAKSKVNSLQAALFEASEAFTNGAGTDTPDTADPQYVIEHAKWLQAEADYTQQNNVIAQLQVSLSSAWLSYSQTSATITAPISGKVANISLAPGSAIAGSNTSTSTNSTSTTTSSSQSYGSIVLEGGTPQATVNLSEIDVTKVKIGQKVTLTLDAFSDKSFTGKIVAINTNGSVSSGVTTYPATIAFDTSVENMYPNMAVNAQIITSIKDDVVLVPSAAVQTVNGSSTIRLMKDSKVTSVAVEVGESNTTQTEIVSGINEGDIVITGSSSSTSTSSTTRSTSSPFGGSGFGGNVRVGGGQGR